MPSRSDSQLEFDQQQQLIEQYLPMAYKYAREVARTHFNSHRFTPDDFESAALLGLVKAARTFHTDRGTQFGTFAYHCIWSELKKVFWLWKRQHGFIRHQDTNKQAQHVWFEPFARPSMLNDDDMVFEPADPTPLCDEALIWLDILAKLDLDPVQHTIASALAEGQTFAQIGAQLGVSRQRVHQRWKKAQEKLQNSPILRSIQ